MSQLLNVEPNIPAADDFYEMLINMHAGLSDADSHAVNARLILLLANQIGDLNLLAQAMQAARGAFTD